MEDILFQTDEILLFERDFLPKDRKWFNVLVRKDKQAYEAFLTEWDAMTDITCTRYHGSFNSQVEAEEKCLVLARTLNRINTEKDDESM